MPLTISCPYPAKPEEMLCKPGLTQTASLEDSLHVFCVFLDMWGAQIYDAPRGLPSYAFKPKSQMEVAARRARAADLARCTGIAAISGEITRTISHMPDPL